MHTASKALFYAYITIGVFALVLTWVHLPPYLGSGFVEGNVQFWKDALLNANPASTFLAVDILFFVLAAEIWMVVDSRRIGMRFVWAYIAVGTFIGISFAFPIYLAMREKHLMSTNSTSAPLKHYDTLLLVLLAAMTFGTGIWLYLK